MKRSRRVRIGKAAWREPFLAAAESTAEAWARPVHSSGNTNDVRRVEAALGELSPVASDERRGRSSTRKYRLAPTQPNLSRVMLRINGARDQTPRKKLLLPFSPRIPVSALFIVRPVRTAKITSVYLERVQHGERRPCYKPSSPLVRAARPKAHPNPNPRPEANCHPSPA